MRCSFSGRSFTTLGENFPLSAVPRALSEVIDAVGLSWSLWGVLMDAQENLSLPLQINLASWFGQLESFSSWPRSRLNLYELPFTAEELRRISPPRGEHHSRPTVNVLAVAVRAQIYRTFQPVLLADVDRILQFDLWSSNFVPYISGSFPGVRHVRR